MEAKVPYECTIKQNVSDFGREVKPSITGKF